MQCQILSIQIFCSGLAFTNWLQNHLLPCPFKYLTGIDCPGCGFQRAIVALIQGDWYKSFSLYPPAIPLLLFFAYGLADKFFKLDNAKDHYKKSFFIITASIVLISYIFKMYNLYIHYTISALAVR